MKRLLIFLIFLSGFCLAQTPPTLVGRYSPATNWSTADTPKTTTALTWQTGDILVVIAGAEGGGSSAYFGTPTGTGLTFTKLEQVIGSSYAEAGLWSATASSGCSNCTISLTSSFGAYWGFTVYLLRGSSGLGNHTVQSSATANKSMALQQAHSSIMWGVFDYTASTVYTIVPTPTNSEAAQVSGRYTHYVANLADKSSTDNYGVQTGSSGMFSIVVLEVKGSSGPTYSSNPVVSMQVSPVLGVAKGLTKGITETLSHSDVIQMDSERSDNQAHVTVDSVIPSAPNSIFPPAAVALSTSVGIRKVLYRGSAISLANTPQLQAPHGQVRTPVASWNNAVNLARLPAFRRSPVAAFNTALVLAVPHHMDRSPSISLTAVPNGVRRFAGIRLPVVSVTEAIDTGKSLALIRKPNITLTAAQANVVDRAQRGRTLSSNLTVTMTPGRGLHIYRLPLTTTSMGLGTGVDISTGGLDRGVPANLAIAAVPVIGKVTGKVAALNLGVVPNVSLTGLRYGNYVESLHVGTVPVVQLNTSRVLNSGILFGVNLGKQSNKLENLAVALPVISNASYLANLPKSTAISLVVGSAVSVALQHVARPMASVRVISATGKLYGGMLIPESMLEVLTDVAVVVRTNRTRRVIIVGGE